MFNHRLDIALSAFHFDTPHGRLGAKIVLGPLRLCLRAIGKVCLSPHACPLGSCSP
jgi:hypothetical protein